MNPTFTLSAADVATLVAATASAATATVNTNFLIGFDSGFQTGSFDPVSASPVCARPQGWLAVRHEHQTQRRGRGRPGGDARTRNQNKNDDSRNIGQRRHQLRGNTKAEALSVPVKNSHCAEQIGTADQTAP